MEFKKESLESGANKNYISFLTQEISSSKISDLTLPELNLNETKSVDGFKCHLCKKIYELKNLEHMNSEKAISSVQTDEIIFQCI